MKGERLKPVSIGEILLEEFMNPLNIDSEKLSLMSGLSTDVISRILSNDQEINQEIAEKLGSAFGTSSAMWIILQEDHTKMVKIYNESITGM